MAARPYLAQGEKSEKQLERLSKRARGVRFFDLQRVQPAPLLYDVQDDESMRRCKRVLYCPSVIPTPAHIKKQLNSYQVALWSVAGRDEWALSTSMETTLLGRGKDTELRWRLETWDEGRGEDYMTLDIGVCFRLEAHASSKPFRSLVRSLGEVTGREIVCCVSYHS